MLDTRYCTCCVVYPTWHLYHLEMVAQSNCVGKGSYPHLDLHAEEEHPLHWLHHHHILISSSTTSCVLLIFKVSCNHLYIEPPSVAPPSKEYELFIFVAPQPIGNSFMTKLLVVYDDADCLHLVPTVSAIDFGSVAFEPMLAAAPSPMPRKSLVCDQ